VCFGDSGRFIGQSVIMNPKTLKPALLALALAFCCVVPARAEYPYHTFAIVEVFSSVDGTVQFVRLHEELGSNNQNFFNSFGTTLTATNGSTTNTYTFPNDLPSNTANKDVLIGTANLATLPGGKAPDYTLPPHFLFQTNGTVSFNPFVSSVSYASLPTNGQQSLFFTPGNTTGTAGTNAPNNFNSTSPGSINVPPGSCCVAAACSVTVQVSCTGIWTSGQTCASNPCTPSTGACCSGATCSVLSQAGCTGTNTRFAGAGTACNALGTSTPCCYGDFNQNSQKTVQDLFDFLAAWFAHGAQADANGGGVTVQDLFDFLAAWFTGCP